MKVAWDDAKNLANQEKHQIAFEDAAELFSSGVDYLELFDEEHSDDEERFLAIGPIPSGIVLVVWTEQDEETIRIISARMATKREQALFHQYMERHR